MKKSLLPILGGWTLWALWQVFLLPQLHGGLSSVLLDGVLVKAALLLLPMLLPFRRKLRFDTHFPWFACLVILCCVTVFLHSVRILNGLQNTYIVFDPVFIILSVSAGVIEELSFRVGFFGLMQKSTGFWIAALINAMLFTLFHYPELIIGQWQGLLSLRALLIFIMGFLFCWMYRKWCSPLLNITVHSYWNILSYLFCIA